MCEVVRTIFHTRPVIRAVVEVMRPEPMMRISDPACGTGGFLLAAFEYLKSRAANAKEIAYLHNRTLHGIDLVSNVARLCAMNLFLQWIGTDPNIQWLRLVTVWNRNLCPTLWIWFLRILHLEKKVVTHHWQRWKELDGQDLVSPARFLGHTK